MTNAFSFLDVTSAPAAERMWSEVAAASPEAWLWHTWRTLTFTISAGAALHPANASFFVMDGADIVGIVPLVIHDGSAGGREASYHPGIGFLPWPACIPGYDRSRFDDAAFPELERRASAAGASYISVSLATPHTGHEEGERAGRVANEFGYSLSHFDMHSTVPTQESLAKAKSRYDFKHFSPGFAFSVAEGEAVTSELEASYRIVHTKDAGRIVRSPESYGLQADFARHGEAFFVVATLKEKSAVAGIALVSFAKGVAYYYSVAIDPEYRRMCVAYQLQCVALDELIKRGITQYDLGPKAGAGADPKELGISRFKEKISRGVTRPIYRIEKGLS